MMILRLLRLDIQKLLAIPLMYVFIAAPALVAFNGWFTSVAFLIYTFLVTYGIFAYDDTSIAENLYGVLPVGREQITVARYLFALVATLFMAILILLINSGCALLFSWPLLDGDFLSALLMGLVCSLVFISIAFPLTMHLGAQKSNTYVLIAFVIIFISMSFYGDNLQREMLNMPGEVILICLLAWMMSCQICLRLYRIRQFYDYTPMKEIRRGKNG